LDVVKFATDIYGLDAKKATQDLMKFIVRLGSDQSAICLTYFDEATELGILFWIMQQLLSNQDEVTSMWYVFMMTKSSVDTFDPVPERSK
jgi:hypothetical protein